MSSILVSGVLVNPFNRPLPNAIITLTSISNSFTVLTGANVTSRTNEAGEYEFHLQPGNYAVYVAKDSYRDFYGAITTTPTTPPTTLNVLLKQNAMEAELPPDLVEFFQHVQNQVVVVGNGVDEAAKIAIEKASEAAASEKSAGAHSTVAGQAASSAGQSATISQEIANQLGDINQIIKDAGFNPVDSFEQGFTLISIGQALRHESTGIFYSWRGSYPKTVPVGSTPERTGGVSKTAWVDVNDLTLRSQITSADGFAIVGSGETTLDKILSIDPRMFGAHSITDEGYETFDSTAAFQTAINYAKSKNIRFVKFSGKYNITGVSGYFNTPGDDGTVYPEWRGRGDENISPEKRHELPVSLVIPDRVSLVADNPEVDELIGDWTLDSSPIDINQKAMILLTEGGNSGICRPVMRNFQISKAFIGVISEGIVYRGERKNMNFSRCGIAAVEQGIEQCNGDNIKIEKCYAGFVRGGWWLQRNNTRLNKQYLPPYPASDAFLVGWVDAEQIYNFVCDVPFWAWSSRHEDIDRFFDDYFFKSKNNLTLNDGGRLSNNSDSDPAVFTPYQGIAGRAYCALSRYGRWVGNVELHHVKSNGHQRPPFYAAQADYCYIFDSYIERTGYVDPLSKAGSFGETIKDVYRPEGYKHSTVSEGFIIGQAVNLVNVQTSNGTRPPAYGIHSTLISPIPFSGGTVGRANRDEFAFERFDSVYNIGAPEPGKYLNYWMKRGTAVPTKTLWELHEDYHLTPDLVFGSDYENRFRYSVESFTPVLLSGVSAISLGNAAARLVRVGMFAIVQMELGYLGDLSMINQSSGFRVQGFPYSINVSGGNTASVTINKLHSNALGVVGEMSGTTLSLKKQYGASDLTKLDLLSVTPTIVRITVMYRANFT
ncbi:Prophage tail fibre N-terminal [Serratia fonticola]|uniref:tail fiber/spike domain-containing protein n=1 Tax=Serratia fonticola TaxID=47917 RepID=UPI0021838785|nr:prophage tail fiber N-terminal domain-containing protein [Serratia fonticola]CAI2146022.1 Prophage tail fibre N-terminal [Serratia fonticola]